MPAQSLSARYALDIDEIDVSTYTAVLHVQKTLEPLFHVGPTEAQRTALAIVGAIHHAREMNDGLDTPAVSEVAQVNAILEEAFPGRDQTHPLAGYLIALSDWRPAKKENR
jgi:hypothetical protein